MEADTQPAYGGDPAVPRQLPDLIGPNVRLLFVGVNPGLRAAATGTPFGGRRGNRFYPALYAAGITRHAIDATHGLVASDVVELYRQGIGITTLAPRPTASAGDLLAAELLEGVASLRLLVARTTPRVVAILGITSYRVAFRRPYAVPGCQREELAGARVWVVPNPSGRNFRLSIGDLADAYREVAAVAGITLERRPSPPSNSGTARAPAPTDVPVAGFGSAAVYNAEGYFEPNEQNAHSVNDTTVDTAADGSATIHFGGDPGPTQLPGHHAGL